MIIEKIQKDTKKLVFNWSYFDSARSGLKYILNTEELKGKKILIPAYIGFSTKEGSGVFDPICETKTKYVFYKLNKKLNIDIDDLKFIISENRECILLLIHYFGFKDEKLEEIKIFAKKYNVIIIEDFAHAFFTFWLDQVINFDYAIFSIHKLFPEESGGMVLSTENIKGENNSDYNLFSHNLKMIIQKRVENYKHLLDRIPKNNISNKIIVLRDIIDRTVPQSFPILLSDSKLRDLLYFQMNKEGYGVVSLYHTLIKEVDDSFVSERELAGRILNLPVHQDAKKEDLDHMIDKMFEIIQGYENE